MPSPALGPGSVVPPDAKPSPLPAPVTEKLTALEIVAVASTAVVAASYGAMLVAFRHSAASRFWPCGPTVLGRRLSDLASMMER